ncbi:MAG: VanW family protein [Oscillospiraceae bacterium]|nr:VanW family protein [Oscillospiraceae bacterium]
MAENTKGGSRLATDETTSSKSGNGLLIALIVLLAIPLVAYGACCALAATADTIFPRTTVLGNDIGGMTEAQAQEHLAPLLGAAYDKNGISIRLDGEEVYMATLTDLGFSPKADESARLAYAAGRSGNVFLDGFSFARALLMGQEIAPALNLTQESLAHAAEVIKEAVNREPQPLSYELSETDLSHIAFTKPRDGVALNESHLTDELEKLLEHGELSAIDCQYSALPYDHSITLDSIAAEILSECRNAGYDAATDSIYEASIGVSFDTAAAAALLDAAAPGETVLVDGTVQFPATYAKDLENGVLFRDLLASYSTKLTGSAGRIGNVRLAARSCNGMVLNTGDEFSFNKRVGKRTEARGYQPAPAYLAGETVDTIGGGICQVSSTLYAACLHANLEITERTAHRYVSSYIKNGLDATVSWGTLDYKFRNNTDYPIKIVTTTNDGKITVMLYGTKVDDSYVVITSKEYEPTGFNVIYQDAPELPAGTEEVKQTPYSGCKVNTYRNVYAGDGTLLSSTDEAFSHYKSRDKIILRGTGGMGDGAGDGTGEWFPPDEGMDESLIPGFNPDEPLMDDPYVDTPPADAPFIDNGEDWVF